MDPPHAEPVVEEEWRLAPGAQVDHFHIVRPLGQGGMSEVYLAKDSRLGRKIALKIIKPERLGSAERVERFLFEARATARFNHPNIITIHEVGEWEGMPYLALEHLEGDDLRARLLRGPLEADDALELMAGVADALREAHARRVLHLDLKPENVMLTADGRPRVVDFGLARVLRADSVDGPGPERSSDSAETAMTSSSFFMLDEGAAKGVSGTPAYMAPEQWQQQELSAATDIWALGVMLHEGLLGHRPVDEQTVIEQAMKVCADAPIQLPSSTEVPAELASLIEACLRKEPAQRPEAEEVLERLREAQRSTSQSISTTALPQQETRQPTALPGSAARSENVAQPEPVATSGTARRVLWYLMTLPLAWGLLVAAVIKPSIIMSAFGLPGDTPGIVGIAIAALGSVSLTWVSTRLERYWRAGGTSPWLHGLRFLVFPAVAFVFELFHYIVLKGQKTVYLIAFHESPPSSLEAARALADPVVLGHRRFLDAVAVDMVGLLVVAFMILLGQLFRTTLAPRSSAPRRPLLLLPGALVAVVLFELLAAEQLSFLGPWRVGHYLLWLLCATTVVVTARRCPGQTRQIWSGLAAGGIAMLALTGAGLTAGFNQATLAVEQAVAREQLPAAYIEWIFDRVVNPGMAIGFALEWLLLALLFAALLLSNRAQLFPTGWRSHLSSAALPWIGGVVLAAAPSLLTLEAMSGASDQWAPFKLVGMKVVRPPDAGGSSFFIDARPQALAYGRDGLYAALRGDQRRTSVLQDRPPRGAIERLLSGTARCPEIIEATLRDDAEAEPARCVTAIEAKLYCEALGKRLPTPDEWLAAGDVVEHGAFGEWTARTVHDTPVFAVAGAERATEDPGELRPESFSPQVGFRCAYSR